MATLAGIVAERPRGRTSGVAMVVEIVLASWQLDDGPVANRPLVAEVVLDLDAADAWLSSLEPGERVEVDLEPGAHVDDVTSRIRGVHVRASKKTSRTETACAESHAAGLADPR